MSAMSDRFTQAANGDRACRSDGAGSPVVVLDPLSRRVLTGALVMWPGQDEAALRALTAYANETGDPILISWAADLTAQWMEAKDGTAWPS